MLLIFSYVVNYVDGRFQKMIQTVRTWIKNHFVTHEELILIEQLLHLETWPEVGVGRGSWAD